VRRGPSPLLAAGTAGTMNVNKLRHRLPREEWEITVVGRDDVHPYQPGYTWWALLACHCGHGLPDSNGY